MRQGIALQIGIGDGNSPTGILILYSLLIQVTYDILLYLSVQFAN